MSRTEFRDASGRRTLHKPEWLQGETPAYSGKRVLDIGCSYKQRGEVSSFYLSLDLSRQRGPMVVGDCHHLPVRDGSVDVVFMFSLLEHVPDPPRAVREARRVLRPGGRLHVTVPFLNFYHDEVDYYRWTEDGLRVLLREFQVVRLERTAAGLFSVLLDWMLSGTFVFPRPVATAAQAVLRLLRRIAGRVDVARDRFYGFLTAEAVKPAG
ncbi:MAG: class I SAM-dependent methyltransferase [Halobacteria archaeon]